MEWEQGETRGAGLAPVDAAWGRRMAIATVLRAAGTERDGCCDDANKPYYDFKDFDGSLYPWPPARPVVEPAAPWGSLWTHRDKRQRRCLGPGVPRKRPAREEDELSGYIGDSADDVSWQSSDSADEGSDEPRGRLKREEGGALAARRHPFGWSSDSEREDQRKEEADAMGSNSLSHELFYLLSHNPAAIFANAPQEIEDDNEPNPSPESLKPESRIVDASSVTPAKRSGPSKEEPTSVDNHDDGQNPDKRLRRSEPSNSDFDPELELTREQRFEIQVRAALDYCGSETGIYRKSKMTVEAPENPGAELVPKAPAPTSNGDAGEDGPGGSEFSAKILQKYGFKGRLGAREDGIQSPVKLERSLGAQRFGLGFVSQAQAKQLAPARKILARVSARKDEPMEVQVAQVTAEAFQEEGDSMGRKTGFPPSLRISAGEPRRTSMAPRNFASNFSTGDYLGENLDYMYETDDQHIPFSDSGRRAIIVDFDVFIRSSEQRRKDAFKQAIEMCPHLRKTAVPILHSKHLDLSDREAAERLHVKSSLRAYSEADCELFLKMLDLCFAKLKPAPNVEIFDAFERAARRFPVLAIHRGTWRRLQDELEALRFLTPFLRGNCYRLGDEDQVPYCDSWKEVLIRVGVPARQSLFVTGGHIKRKVSSGLIAGLLLGARTLSVIDCDGIKQEPVEVESAEGGGVNEMLVKDYEFHKVINLPGLVRKTVKTRKFRKVLALNEGEGLYFAGRELLVKNINNGRLHYVRFCAIGKCEWVKSTEVQVLNKEKYEVLRENKFPGLANPDDVWLFM